MTDQTNPDWTAIAEQACSRPTQPTTCPICHAEALHATWRIAEISSRIAEATLRCDMCGVQQKNRIVLPASAPEFFPLEQVFSHGEAFFSQVSEVVRSVQEHERILSAATWMIHPNWLLASWAAMAYQWHPTGEAPPILGLSFENADMGKELFQSWIDKYGHYDELEEIRISIIEGDIPGHNPGYSIHICPDPDNSLVRATAEGIALDMLPFTLLGQVRRMYPVAGEPLSLPRFKEEFEAHQEFMLAPVVRRDDGNLWAIPELGIIKTTIQFRDVSEVALGDIDEVVLRAPLVNRPATNDE